MGTRYVVKNSFIVTNSIRADFLVNPSLNIQATNIIYTSLEMYFYRPLACLFSLP